MVERTDRGKNLPSAANQAGSPEEAVDMGRVFREHAQTIFRTAYRVTGNPQDAEDVLQTVFLRLVRREAGAPLSDSPAHYLHRAAVNAALDVVRSRRAARIRPLDDVEPQLTCPPERSPERLHGSSEIRNQVRKALGDLSPKSAEIFILRYFEGYDNHEIARMVGTSRSTVAVVLHRTRHRLREVVGSPMGEKS